MLITHLILAELRESDPELFEEILKEVEKKILDFKNLNNDNGSKDSVKKE